MLPYFSAFALTLALGLAAEHVESQIAKSIVLCLSVMPLCVLAGCRSLTIGIDTADYPVYLTSGATESDYCSFMSKNAFVVGHGSIEPLYATLVWVTANTVGGVPAVLFLTQLLTALPIAEALRRFSPRGLSAGLIAYAFLFFPFSLNIMRQSIAMGMIVLSVTLMASGRNKASAIIMVLSFGFHVTAVLGLPIVLLLYAQQKGMFLFGKAFPPRSLLYVQAWPFIAVALVVLLVATAPMWLPMLANLKGSYSYQIAHMGEGEPSESVVMLGLAAMLALFLMAPQLKRAMANECQLLHTFLMLVLIGAIVAQLSIVSPQMGRLGYVFLYMVIPFFSLLRQCGGNGSGTLPITMVLIIILPAFFLACWGGTELVPYQSVILGVVQE